MILPGRFLTEQYDVTVNSYVAGWDGSVFENATVVGESNTLYGTALLEYVQQNSPVAPTDENRIRRIDAEVETRSVEASESEVTVTLAAPEGVQNVSDAFRAVSGDSDRTATGSATLSGDAVTVTFDRSDLRSVADGEAVQLYGGYNTSAYQRVYFEHSVLNAEVPTDEFAAETTTATPTTTASETTGTTTATERAVEDETATTDGSSGSIPGFTPVTVAVALVAAALLALRRT